MMHPDSYQQTSLYSMIMHLSPLPGPAMTRLFASVEKMQFPKGAYLLQESQICNHIFFVENGYLRVFVSKDGTEINTGFVFENNFATNLRSLRSGSPSESFIQAGEAVTVFRFDKNKLKALYEGSPETETFGRTLLEQLLIEQEEHANMFRIYSPAERYKQLLTQNPELLKRVSLSQIASYLGVTRETLSRIRKIK